MSERAGVAAGLAGAMALSWIWLIAASRDMYGSMQGLSAWMMAGTWDLRYSALIFAMWVAMMVSMMLPSATPAILAFCAGAERAAPQAETPVARTYAFVAGCLYSHGRASASRQRSPRVCTRAIGAAFAHDGQRQSSPRSVDL